MLPAADGCRDTDGTLFSRGGEGSLRGQYRRQLPSAKIKCPTVVMPVQALVLVDKGNPSAA
jgi:hypothetical protein